MKNLVLVIGCLVAFNASAWTGGCIKMDYEEVKDLSDHDLSLRYCRQQYSAESADRMAHAPMADNGDIRHAAECREIADQVKRVVEKRKLVVDCSTDFWTGE